MIYYSGCYALKGIKIGNTIYGKVIKSKHDHIFRKDSYRSVTATTFVRIPKRAWKLIRLMDESSSLTQPWTPLTIRNPLHVCGNL